MPVLLDEGSNQGAAAVDTPARSDCLDIGLLNNLSDGGLVSGERQFITLLEAASGDLMVRLKLYSLPHITRGIAMRERIGALYSSLPDLMNGRLDGLFVTGAEPVQARLSDEAYWPGLTAIVDWAEHHTTSTLWSCLAAHAAVLHLDGIERQPLGAKRSGIYEFNASSEHKLMAGVSAPHRVPHSRYNDLREGDLRAHGYEILTQSPTHGVDAFAKQWRSLFVYLQGHPEYDAQALGREYRRDVLRFLSGEAGAYPRLPETYFTKAVEDRLRRFEGEARRDRVPETFATFPINALGSGLRSETWHQDSTRLIRNWLLYLAAQKS